MFDITGFIVPKGFCLNTFNQAGKLLLTQGELHLKGQIFELTETEFYCWDKNNKHWQDWAIHANPHILGVPKCEAHLQARANLVYTHGAGLDITFGSASNYGGILIRGIKNAQGQFVTGPLRTYDALRALCTSADDLRRSLDLQIGKVRKVSLFQGPRVHVAQNKQKWPEPLTEKLLYWKNIPLRYVADAFSRPDPTDSKRVWDNTSLHVMTF
jgi:hypothetical protein